jgi:NitT/TauT family transport system ATP-binding protein
MAGDTDSAITLRGVSKSFRGREGEMQALEALDLDVRPGEFVCLLGASGCGKSTLLNLIAGLERATSGTVVANGKPVTGPGPDRVLMCQDAALFPWLNAQANVEFGLRQQRVPRAERAAIAKTWIERVHCADSSAPTSTPFRAGCASGSPWPARWPSTPLFCLWTNRLARSTP